MRRMTAVTAVCALATVLAVVAASGNAERPAYQAMTPRRLGLMEARLRPAKQNPKINSKIAAQLRAAVNPTPTCFVTSGNQSCSLIPCTGFVSASVGPDWVPISGDCAGVQFERGKPVGRAQSRAVNAATSSLVAIATRAFAPHLARSPR